MRRRFFTILIFGMMAVALAALSFAVYRLTHPTPLVPASILKQVEFVPMVPDARSGWQLQTGSLQYDATQKVLFFNVTNGTDKLIFSEQATPDQFSDIQGYQDAFLAKLNQYKDFDTAAGTVYLTHPTELSGGQSAVLNEQGTLLFARPSHNLTDNEWRNLFDNTVQVH